MAAQRDAAARGADVGLGADRVLLVAQVIGGVGERLDHRDAEIGGVRLGPARRQHRQAVEHHLTKTAVVLGQVVDVGSALRRRRAAVGRQAVGGRGAAGLEGEVDAGQLRIDAVGRIGDARAGDERKRDRARNRRSGRGRRS